MAPVVLWIDEIEKAFASAASESADGGLSQRMFGTLFGLDAGPSPSDFPYRHGQRHRQVPPELMRKGRFDESSSSILPEPEDRRAIFTVHLGTAPHRISSIWNGWWPPRKASAGRNRTGDRLRTVRRVLAGNRVRHQSTSWQPSRRRTRFRF